jgi:hypothetical protein
MFIQPLHTCIATLALIMEFGERAFYLYEHHL